MKVFLLFLLVIGLAVAEAWLTDIRASRSADPVAVAEAWLTDIRASRSADPVAVAEAWLTDSRASRSADPAHPRRWGPTRAPTGRASRWVQRSADPVAAADPAKYGHG
ncbi:uncharacterized protein LOC135379105 [Ornithodoros turicata]|uniref:uncharacterized protein LOC135379105 n=1 Tax=Ornithodoros turicata TaxID=34597 RepID=UPI00313A455C